MSPVKALVTMGSLKGDNSCATTYPQQVTTLGCSSMAEPVMSAMDIHMKEAMEQAEREGTERPLVMQQLRTKIQLDRLKGGKGELSVTFEEPKSYPLTKEEMVKQDKRKRRNREAAQKSRVKKKKQLCELGKENQKLKERNDQLRAEVNALYDLTSGFQEGIRRVRNCPHSPHAQAVQIRPGRSVSVTSPQLLESLGRMDSGQFTKSLSQRFPRGQRIVIRRDSKHLAKIGLSPVLALQRPSSNLHVEILRCRDPPQHTLTRHCSTSPRAEVMEIEESPPKIFSMPRVHQERQSCPPQNVPIITVEEDCGAMTMRGHSGPPILPLPQGVDEALPSGVSFLQMLKEAENPGQMIEPSSGVSGVSLHGERLHDAFLMVDSSAPSSAKVLASPASPSSPSAIFGAMHQLPRGS